MKIRKYQTSDCEEIGELFYHTVHTVNAKDYTKEQLNVWATGQIDLEMWNQSFQEHYTIVAVDNNLIVGFGDIDKTGYLDRYTFIPIISAKELPPLSAINWNRQFKELSSPMPLSPQTFL